MAEDDKNKQSNNPSNDEAKEGRQWPPDFDTYGDDQSSKKSIFDLKSDDSPEPAPKAEEPKPDTSGKKSIFDLSPEDETPKVEVPATEPEEETATAFPWEMNEGESAESMDTLFSDSQEQKEEEPNLDAIVDNIKEEPAPEPEPEPVEEKVEEKTEEPEPTPEPVIEEEPEPVAEIVEEPVEEKVQEETPEPVVEEEPEATEEPEAVEEETPEPVQQEETKEEESKEEKSPGLLAGIFGGLGGGGNDDGKGKPPTGGSDDASDDDDSKSDHDDFLASLQEDPAPDDDNPYRAYASYDFIEELTEEEKPKAGIQLNRQAVVLMLALVFAIGYFAYDNFSKENKYVSKRSRRKPRKPKTRVIELEQEKLPLWAITSQKGFEQGADLEVILKALDNSGRDNPFAVPRAVLSMIKKDLEAQLEKDKPPEVYTKVAYRATLVGVLTSKKKTLALVTLRTAKFDVVEGQQKAKIIKNATKAMNKAKEDALELVIGDPVGPWSVKEIDDGREFAIEARVVVEHEGEEKILRMGAPAELGIYNEEGDLDIFKEPEPSPDELKETAEADEATAIEEKS